MMDRMGVRNKVALELMWMIPPGDPPIFADWRNSIEQLRVRHASSNVSMMSESTTESASSQTTNLARSFRVFLTWKK
jgi:hypothetical protein